MENTHTRRKNTDQQPVSPIPEKKITIHRHRQERFLKGPIPMPWLEEAARLPGKALHVAMMLWHLAGMRRSMVVDLNLSRMTDMGAHRSSASRGLKVLERAGLVTVTRLSGRKPRVTIIRATSPQRG